MFRLAAHSRYSYLLFLAIAATVYTAAIMLVRMLPDIERPGVLAAGIAVDMLVIVPAAYYFLVIRRRLPFFAVLPMLIVSLIAAYQILPPEHQSPLHLFEALLAPLELFLFGWIVVRSVMAMRRARRDVAAEPLVQFRRAACDLFKNDRVAGVFASEIGMFYYALLAWRARPHVPEGMVAFTHHKRSGQLAIVLGFLVLLAAEGSAVHLLLMRWSSPVAWVITALTIYGALFILSDYRATVLRPILVGDDEVVVRAGLRYTMRVPRSQIAGVGNEKPEFGRESVKFAFLATPTHWVTLSERAEAHGMYGIRARVRAFGIEPDDPAGFESALGPGRPQDPDTQE